MTAENEALGERRDGLRAEITALADTLREHMRTETPMVERLGGQIADIRAEQRIVLRELAVEQANVLAGVKADQVVVRGKLDANTALTQEVRDILTTFKMVGGFAKWLGAIVAAAAAAWAAITGLRS